MEKQLSFFSPLNKKPEQPPFQKSEKDTTPPCTPPKNTSEKFTIFIDGAARGNPGDAGAGIFISLNGKDLIKKGFFLGTKTNNQAEYLALVLALLLLHDFLAKHAIVRPNVCIYSDSELLIKQMNNTYKTKNPALNQLQAFIATQLKHIHHTFTHVMRENNKVADKLANQGIDKKNIPPASYQTLLSQHGLLF